jgi:hypothetical protein
VNRLEKKKGEVDTMGSLNEKEIKAYRIKTKTKAAAGVVAEDVIHDSDSVFCVRCQKKIK